MSRVRGVVSQQGRGVVGAVGALTALAGRGDRKVS